MDENILLKKTGRWMTSEQIAKGLSINRESANRRLKTNKFLDKKVFYENSHPISCYKLQGINAKYPILRANVPRKVENDEPFDDLTHRLDKYIIVREGSSKAVTCSGKSSFRTKSLANKYIIDLKKIYRGHMFKVIKNY